MSVENVKNYLKRFGKETRVIELEESSATVELAANALGCEPAHIAKTISFLTKNGPVLIVAPGDRKIDNKKYKECFGEKASMVPWEQVEGLIGHAPGGVCPFAIKEGVRVFLDQSLLQYEWIYPAAGSCSSCVKLTPAELAVCTEQTEWKDLTK